MWTKFQNNRQSYLHPLESSTLQGSVFWALALSYLRYDEICKYFAEGSQKDNNTNEVQKHLQLHNVSVRGYLTDKYALWLDFRTIDESELHGISRRIENASEGITLQIEKKEESVGALNAYIYLIMDAQLNIQNGTYVSAVY